MTPKELAVYAHSHYGNPSESLYVIGVTGTNGKTTVSYLIGEVLKAAGFSPFVLGTLNSGNTDLSTPESIDIVRLMRTHLDQGGTHFVMEVTSEGIDQLRVSGIDFDIKLLTNITQDHLDYHKTFENYQAVKLGFMRDGDAKKIYPKHFKHEPIDFTTLLLGDFNLLNIKAATSVLRHMSINEICIQKVLSSCPSPRGRLENIEKGQDYMVIIDYAHTPDAMKNVLTTVKKIADSRNGRLLVLFGCGGNRDRGKRPKMGKIASEIADILVITDDNPRSENSLLIMDNVVKGISSEFKDFTLIQNRKAAITTIINRSKNNDVVILLGKGHETYQILALETIHFDDKEEVSEAIAARLKNETVITSISTTERIDSFIK
jgi:UDP-N-acetylmuramoyl-L-alanyl-D-glutamate--2,6-diaminopimelate ligase